MEGTIGEIRLFGGNFAPRNWAFCEGQLLPIAQNTALFAILGTIYGGDGRTTCGLPDLKGRVALHDGAGPGLPTYSLGSKGGTATNTLTINNIPSHTHSGTIKVADGKGDSFGANGNYIAQKAIDVDANPNTTVEVYKTAAGATFNSGNTVNGSESTATGGGQAIDNHPPFLGLRFIICLQGTFPSRS